MSPLRICAITKSLLSLIMLTNVHSCPEDLFQITEFGEFISREAAEQD